MEGFLHNSMIYKIKTIMENIYYCYIYLDTRKPGNYIYDDLQFNFKPFYVGKGKGNRSMVHLTHAKRSNVFFVHHLHRTINAILKQGLEPIILKYEENLYEEESYKLEEILINKIGLQNLTNIWPGGNGGRANKNFAGRIHTIETREKMRIKKLGDNNPMYGANWTRSEPGKKSFTIAMSGSNHFYFNTKRTDEVRDKIRKKLKDVKLSDDQKIERSNSMKKVWEYRKANNIKLERSKPNTKIKVYNENGELIFESMSKCAQFLKCSTNSLKSIIRNHNLVNNYYVSFA